MVIWLSWSSHDGQYEKGGQGSQGQMVKMVRSNCQSGQVLINVKMDKVS